jgi:hypothetical protein
MKMAKKINKAELRAFEQMVISGLRTLLPARTIPIAGSTVKSVDLQAQLRQHLVMLDAVDAARAKLHAVVAEERALRATLEPLIAGLRGYALGVFGEASADFRTFGFRPHVVGVKSAETKARAVAKLRATRTARSTRGKREKMSILGTIEIAPATHEPTVVTNGAPANGAVAH